MAKGLKTSTIIFFSVLGILMLSFKTEALDSRWKLYHENVWSDNYYYDSESFEYPQNNLVKVWHKLIFLDHRILVKELTYLDEIDCSKRIYRNLDFRTENRNGELKIYPGTFVLLNIEPGSKMEILYETVCKKANKTSKPTP